MTAKIQFSRGVTEDTVPDIRVTRARRGESGTATFTFEDPQILAADNTAEVTGMYLIDEDGELLTRDVKVKFYDGKARVVEATLIMQTAAEWQQFLRFMERYAETAGLELQRKSDDD
ncbi:MAG: photosystem II reaction center protein Psb28 [Spirulina sp. SIO3F2]|nr:photosystem II reaction center protein Psb28 [Spirulina sp. SIO3F2]